MRRRALLALAAALVSAPALAQPTTLSISGRVAHPSTMTLPDLRALPPVTVAVTHPTQKGERTATYTGALLWPLIVAAAPIDQPGRATSLQHTILARGADDYAAALAIAELDPGFANKQVIVAYAEDGAPLPALHLIVPGDTRAGRSVRDLVSIEVR